MASYWETLGWIESQLGHQNRAEKLLSAVWSLSQSPSAGDRLGQVYEKQRKPDQASRMYQLAISAASASSPMKETRTRLAHLGNQPKVNGPDELTKSRTLKVDLRSTAEGAAEFFLLVGEGAKIVETRFISGSEHLRGAGKTLKSLSLPGALPGSGPAKLVRRGLLACAPQSGCSLLFYTAERVRSMD